MNIRHSIHHVMPLLAFALMSVAVNSQNLNDYRYNSSFNPDKNTVVNAFQFNGYTNYWHDTRRNWISYGNLFKMALPDVEYTIAQSKADIADDLKIPGFSLQEGFINQLLKGQYTVLDQPSLQKLTDAAALSNVLVLVDPGTEAGKALTGKLPTDNQLKATLKSHQNNAIDFIEVKAFYIENGTKRIFVIASADSDKRKAVSALIEKTKQVLSTHELKRGWFGAETLVKSVTCTAGHPLDVIGRGMNEGNSWFTFSGYMDFLAQNELTEWLAKVKLPVVTDVGSSMDYTPNKYSQAIFGCDNYKGLQVQDMYTVESCLKFAHDRNGYMFRSVYDPDADMYAYDGYIATEGNKEQIDNEEVPFITSTGSLDGDAVPCMVLFTGKGEQMSKKVMWDAIMNRREVAILGNGKMMGPALYRNTLELLLLDRVYLEEYFGSRISLEASTADYQLNVNITNTYNSPVSGTLEIVLPPELQMAEPASAEVKLPAGGSMSLQFRLQPTANAMARTNPIAVNYKWNTGRKSTLTMIDLPPAISAHQLLYGHSPMVTYPVTLHNYTDNTSFPVRIEVLDKNDSKKIVFSDTKTCNTSKGTFRDMTFELKVAPGSYNVKITAFGNDMVNQLGVGKAEGKPALTAIDLNNDGVDEYVMENDSVKVTLLATGGRMIEYFIKSRNDNAVYRIWPIKPIDDKRVFRKRGYYPYGGFEDFLGQASMETHKLYTAEILKKEGDYVQVRMTADYFGNKLEKTYTLYGNSPLLEVRFAITFSNPEANMIAPVPVLDLGEKHWTEDVFMVPSKDGIQEYRMKPERYYGKIFFLKEGWDAGYDTKEDIAFISAFPVKPPLFLHMFMNHPRNGDAHFYCHEFQPWVPILQKTTTYFTFYMWGAGGKWQNGVKELRDRNLITQQ
ncbi:MAG: hypothetical protein IPN67_18290 [Bacteroidales bacterium]|nr:hypothetical protein [Bacteroidales bacterium]